MLLERNTNVSLLCSPVLHCKNHYPHYCVLGHRLHECTLSLLFLVMYCRDFSPSPSLAQLGSPKACYFIGFVSVHFSPANGSCISRKPVSFGGCVSFPSVSMPSVLMSYLPSPPSPSPVFLLLLSLFLFFCVLLPSLFSYPSPPFFLHTSQRSRMGLKTSPATAYFQSTDACRIFQYFGVHSSAPTTSTQDIFAMVEFATPFLSSSLS